MFGREGVLRDLDIKDTWQSLFLYFCWNMSLSPIQKIILKILHYTFFVKSFLNQGATCLSSLQRFQKAGSSLFPVLSRISHSILLINTSKFGFLLNSASKPTYQLFRKVTKTRAPFVKGNWCKRGRCGEGQGLTTTLK